ncbi:ATP-binding cassette domain-containing protein [Schlesneria paludicola]|uniref:ATP-binding cassette domain-containing protein n=1 Tax=Schlesneria paludicola TaxID=360056 RepID=UPI00029A2711|nr:ATP-binding cassette domain-containing protein [Schlesneria paludicola]
MSFRLTFTSKDSPVLWSLVNASLAGRHLPRLDDVTVTIQEGVTAVLGQSGSGKTSLLNLLVGFEQPSSGRVTFHKAPKDERLAVFWAPPQQGLWPHLSVREHLTTVAPAHDRSQIDHDADELLEQFDLRQHAFARPDSLSLGERSRLNVARALFSRARVLVMDEPLSHVDEMRCGRYWSVIRDWCRQHEISLVFSTHQSDVALQEAQQVICVLEGRIPFQGQVDELYERPATREIASLLGPCNWFTAEERDRWCHTDSVPFPAAAELPTAPEWCVRPERLAVTAEADAPVTVQQVHVAGAVAEIELCDTRTHTTKRVVYRPITPKRLQRGEQVVLKILTLFLMVFISGCLGQSEPTLSVKRESNWMMPPDGHRVPAPRGITVSSDNEYLVLDNAGRVLVFNENGDLTRQWWMPEYSVGKAEGICVLKDGRIAVADTHYHRIVFFNHDGEVTGMFGQRGSGEGDFVYPVSIIQAPDDFIYICEYGQNDRVQKFRPDGTFVLQFGGAGTEPGQFQRPSGIAWYDHELFVVDAFNNRVQVFSEEGQLLRIMGDSENAGAVHYPYDITVNPRGELFVVEYGAGRVTKFTRQGKLLGRYGHSGPGQTLAQFSTPWGLTIDRRNRLYVCDTGNRRVVEIEL